MPPLFSGGCRIVENKIDLVEIASCAPDDLAR
jgi:hypothetical protein